jgi:hypothetical protein
VFHVDEPARLRSSTWLAALLLSSVSVAFGQQTTSAPRAVATTGTRNIAIILVNYNDNQSQPPDQATARQGLTLLNEFFQEASYGRLSSTGTVYGYLQLPLSISVTCASDNFTAITDAGIQAAKSAGIDLSPYQSYVFLGPLSSACPHALSLGSVGGDPGLVVMGSASQLTDVSLLQHALAHEVGHNIGLGEASSINCGSAPDAPLSSCQELLDGNLWDVDGSGTGHYNAALKEFLRWLSPFAVSATGIYNVGPLETIPGSLPRRTEGRAAAEQRRLLHGVSPANWI